MDSNQKEESQSIEIKKPKRIFHCSDGIYEESSDEEEENKVENFKDLSLIRQIGHTVIYSLDYLGEAIAGFFNITTPKYSYEIEQFKKMQAERALEEQEEKDNSWTIDAQYAEDNETKQPIITEVPRKSSP